MDENAAFKAGLAVRKKVLGEDYVNASLAAAEADDFMRPLQQYLTEHAWGFTWVRDGLSLKTRSMLNLAMLVALNHPNELKLHIRGALNNGVTKEEMREIFLQCGVYCGAPAALDAFKTAQQVFKEEAAKQAG
jgi:4-carboxymuconolactone decarboxylase